MGVLERPRNTVIGAPPPPRSVAVAARALMVVWVGATLSSCGGSATTASRAPRWPKGPWPARVEGYFMEACESSPIPASKVDAYCICVLRSQMRRNPIPKPPSTAADAGQYAAEHPRAFPACAGRGGRPPSA